MKFKNQIPFALTTLRLCLGPVTLWCAYERFPRIWFLPILITGLLSDIYDGVLARRFGVSTPALRRYDSITDLIYYLFILASAWILAKGTLLENRFWIITLLSSEAICIAVSLIKFRRFPATHSYLAKTYGLALFASLVMVLCFSGHDWVLLALCIVGLTANTEILVILLLAKQAPVDVLSLFHFHRKGIEPQSIS